MPIIIVVVTQLVCWLKRQPLWVNHPWKMDPRWDVNWDSTESRSGKIEICGFGRKWSICNQLIRGVSRWWSISSLTRPFWRFKTTHCARRKCRPFRPLGWNKESNFSPFPFDSIWKSPTLFLVESIKSLSRFNEEHVYEPWGEYERNYGTR